MTRCAPGRPRRGSPACTRARERCSRRALAIGDWYCERADRAGSLEYYLAAVAAHAGDTDAGRPRPCAPARRRRAVLARRRRPRGPRALPRGAARGTIDGADLELYRSLRVRLSWERLDAARLGLSDANISSLAVDGDDLWVGTWNGGTARWSLSAERLRGLPEPRVSPGLRADRPAGLGRDLRGAGLVRARYRAVVDGARAAGTRPREGPGARVRRRRPVRGHPRRRPPAPARRGVGIGVRRRRTPGGS